MIYQPPLEQSDWSECYNHGRIEVVYFIIMMCKVNIKSNNKLLVKHEYTMLLHTCVVAESVTFSCTVPPPE